MVVVLGSGQPIPAASIELRRADCNSFASPPEVVTATTDGNGKFEFQNLHAGGWCIVATVPGGQYTPAEYMQRGVLGRGATIPIADGQRVTGIQLSMAPTGGIAGRVRDADGEPMAHARVQVMEPFNEEGQRRLYILQVAQTNDLGEYRFFWLPPAAYYVAVIPENTKGRSVVSVQPPPGTGGHREDVIAPVIMPRITPNGETVEEPSSLSTIPAKPTASVLNQSRFSPGAQPAALILCCPPAEFVRTTSAEQRETRLPVRRGGRPVAFGAKEMVRNSGHADGHGGSKG
jgi:hypothetical protein